MIDTSDGTLFPYFQDIVERCHADDIGEASSSSIDVVEDEINEEQQPQLASSLPMDAIQKELKKRDLQPRGFFNEDAALLQKQFDQELEQVREEKRQQRVANRERLERERQQQIVEKEIQLEREELEKDEQLSTLLASAKQGRSSSHTRIELNRITARSLAFALCSPECSLLYLDVSNQSLCDLAGAYVCRSLAKNTSIKKIELSNNRLGPLSFQELGRGLMNNKAVEFVSLDCNPLAGDGTDDDDNNAVQSLADMIGRNKTLRHLGLWQCFIGAKGGKLIATALKSSNDNLTTLKCGYNNWDDASVRKIDAKLASNRDVRRVEREKETMRKQEEELRRLEQERLDEELKRKLAKEEWLEEQKKIRAEERRLQMEAEEKARIERERAEEEERQRVAAEEAAKLAAKKKKKKAKSKKKK
mmetsp:Transcript_33763/g.99465  ORF Transcript_33763/g.99465 Transcript_33763/m.99465 type:complete len:418 (-) Transcript_33763:1230-2483(-)